MKIKRIPKRHYRQWTRKERIELRRLARVNTPTRLIAMKLGRTTQAIYKMANRMGVSLKPSNQGPYNRRTE